MTQSFSGRREIETTQFQLLQTLWREIIPANRFYTAKLKAAGADAPPESIARLVQTVPFTVKPELVADQAGQPPYGTNLTYPLERYTRYHQTSGTSGQPMRWLDTPESWCWMLRNWEEVFRVAGTAPEDRVFFAFSFGPFLGFWTAFEAALRIGCLTLPGGGMSSPARLQAILDNEVTILCCTPTYAVRLAEVAAGEKIDLRRSRVRVILVAGEPGGSIPAVRERLASLWPGARVFDHHGMTEVGPVTFECPARPGVLHVMEPGYLPEVIDPATGAPVSPGQTGELVLSTLGRVGSPLLRYRTGDLVKASPEGVCACGRSQMALEGGILGRVDDMLIVRGVNVYPSAVENLVRQFPEIAEYQVNVSTAQALTELAVSIEPVPDCADVAGLAHCLERALQSAFALRVPVKAVSPGTLPRFEMKAKRWRRV